jgi:pimeloyl-ACP methyl ester carboxylesterase
VETTAPVLFLHGLSGSARWWRRIEAAVAARHEVHVLDLPGFGKLRDQAFALADAPAFVRRGLEEQQLARVHLVGHSLGGLVAARVAAGWPDRVDRLVLVSPVGVPHRSSAVGHVLPLARAVLRSRPTLLHLLAWDAVRAGPLTIWRAARDVLADDVVPELRAVRAPTLLIWGELDPLVPPSLGEVFRAQIPDARLEILPQARHVPMVERPDEFCRLVLDFLRP